MRRYWAGRSSRSSRRVCGLRLYKLLMFMAMIERSIENLPARLGRHVVAVAEQCSRHLFVIRVLTGRFVKHCGGG